MRLQTDAHKDAINDSKNVPPGEERNNSSMRGTAYLVFSGKQYVIDFVYFMRLPACRQTGFAAAHNDRR